MSGRPEINLLGWYLEELEDGPGYRIVLVQPSDSAPDGQVEHVAEGPAQLWAAFEAIAHAPDLPKPGAMAVQADAVYDDEEEADEESELEERGADIRSFVTQAAESVFTDAAGPLVGRIAGQVVRNPGRAVDFLRAISRKDRR